MKKYFFFDIDGTLAPPGASVQDVPASTKEAIQELRKRGHFCALATGRPACTAAGIGRDLGFDDYVSDGGNGITLNGELISLDPMPHENCVALADECDEHGYLWAVSTENEPVRYCRSPKFHDALSKSEVMHDVVTPDLDIRQCPKVYKMFVACKPGEEENLTALSGLSWERFTPEFFIAEPGNKEVGIRKIMDHFQAPYEDVVVFGDGINDLSMFQPEWTSIAMGNAVPELKAKADFVTRDCDDDGIAYALKHFGWI